MKGRMICQMAYCMVLMFSVFTASGKDVLTIWEVVAVQGGANQWTRVTLLRDGNVIKIRNQDIHSISKSINLMESDIIAFGEASEKLLNWEKDHPSERVPESVLSTLPESKLFRADGTRVDRPSRARSAIGDMPISAATLDGAFLARTALLDSKVVQDDIQSNELKNKVRQKISALSTAERLAFVAELARTIALEEQQAEREHTVYAAMALMQMSETSPAERAQAISRLFESSDQKMQKTADGLLAGLSDLKSPNGTQGRDISVYRAALAERSGISQSRLIECLFMKYPVETASWFVENIDLPENDRTTLRAEVVTAGQIESNTNHPWEPTVGSTMNNADRERKLREWIASPLWILQLLGKSFFEKYPPWQTPDIQISIQKLAAPPNVILRPIHPELAPVESNETSKATPDVSPITLPAPIAQSPAPTSTPTFDQHMPVWSWVVGIFALVIIGVLYLKRRA